MLLESFRLSKESSYKILVCTYSMYILLAMIGVFLLVEKDAQQYTYWLILPSLQLFLTVYILQSLIRRIDRVRILIKVDLILSILYLPMSLLLFGFNMFLPIAMGHFTVMSELSTILGAKGSTNFPYLIVILIFDVYLLLFVNPSLNNRKPT